MSDEKKPILLLDFPFKKVVEALPDIENVDGFTASLSPITIRWLTKKNIFINVGLVELEDKKCEVKADNNTYNVTPEEIAEVHEGIVKALGDKDDAH